MTEPTTPSWHKSTLSGPTADRQPEPSIIRATKILGE